MVLLWSFFLCDNVCGGGGGGGWWRELFRHVLGVSFVDTHQKMSGEKLIVSMGQWRLLTQPPVTPCGLSTH